MFAPDDVQTDVCVLKSNLEEIEKELNVQDSKLPTLDEENDKKYRETINALEEVRSTMKEMESLELKHVQLTAKRIQLMIQSDELIASIESARRERDELAAALKQEDIEIEMMIRKYEDSMQEKADRFRTTHRYYDEKQVNTEIEELKKVIPDRENEMRNKQRLVDGLKAQLDAIQPDVPENILEQMGKLELEEKLKLLTEKCEVLEKKRKAVTKKRRYSEV